jgi:hypothetical protein
MDAMFRGRQIADFPYCSSMLFSQKQWNLRNVLHTPFSCARRRRKQNERRSGFVAHRSEERSPIPIPIRAGQLGGSPSILLAMRKCRHPLPILHHCRFSYPCLAHTILRQWFSCAVQVRSTLTLYIGRSLPAGGARLRY